MTAICALCEKRFDPDQGGGMVTFRKRTSDVEWDRQVGDKNMISHPPYACWFCPEHYPRALTFAERTIDEALAVMRAGPDTPTD